LVLRLEVRPELAVVNLIGAGHQLGFGLPLEPLSVFLGLRAGPEGLGLAPPVRLVPADIPGGLVLTHVADVLCPLVQPCVAHGAAPWSRQWGGSPAVAAVDVRRRRVGSGMDVGRIASGHDGLPHRLLCQGRWRCSRTTPPVLLFAAGNGIFTRHSDRLPWLLAMARAAGVCAAHLHSRSGQPAQRTGSNNMSRRISIVLLLSFLPSVALACCGPAPFPASTAGPAPTGATAEIFQEYLQDKQSAEKKYLGRTMTFTGQVGAADEYTVKSDGVFVIIKPTTSEK